MANLWGGSVCPIANLLLLPAAEMEVWSVMEEESIFSPVGLFPPPHGVVWYIPLGSKMFRPLETFENLQVFVLWSLLSDCCSLSVSVHKYFQAVSMWRDKSLVCWQVSQTRELFLGCVVGCPVKELPKLLIQVVLFFPLKNRREPPTL